jgi:hypothetical protein
VACDIAQCEPPLPETSSSPRIAIWLAASEIVGDNRKGPPSCGAESSFFNFPSLSSPSHGRARTGTLADVAVKSWPFKYCRYGVAHHLPGKRTSNRSQNFEAGSSIRRDTNFRHSHRRWISPFKCRKTEPDPVAHERIRGRRRRCMLLVERAPYLPRLTTKFCEA